MPYKDIRKTREAQRRYMQRNKEYYLEKKKQYIQERKDFLNEFKLKLGCKFCGGKEKLQFHHRDQLDKTSTISDMIFCQKNKKDFLAEIAKCDVVCLSCHIIIHKKEGRLKQRRKKIVQDSKLDNYI